MISVNMLAPPGTTTVMADGVNYLVSNGSVTVPASLVNSLEEAGFIEQSAGSLALPTYATDASGNVIGLKEPDGSIAPVPVTVYQSAVPVGIAQSGTVATNGTITFAVALPTAYAGIWLYFPANAITNNGGNPGFYWCTTVGASTINFQVRDAYLSDMGIPTVPTGYGNAIGSNSAYTGSTAEVTLGSVTISGNVLGNNGAIYSTPSYRANAGVGTKTLLTRFGGTAFTGDSAITATYTAIDRASLIMNRGSKSSQVSPSGSGWAPYPSLAAATNAIYGSVDTTADNILKFTGQSINAADYIILESAIATIYPK